MRDTEILGRIRNERGPNHIEEPRRLTSQSLITHLKSDTLKLAEHRSIQSCTHLQGKYQNREVSSYIY